MSATAGSTRADERRQRVLDQRIATAQAIVEDGRAEKVLVQDLQVYVQQGVCAGCSKVGPWLVDKHDAWCPGCGGRALVHLDVTDYADFENGLCRVGTSPIIHLVAPPIGEHPVCLRGTTFGRMRPVKGDDADVTCQRCIAERDGTHAYGHGPAKTKSKAGTR